MDELLDGRVIDMNALLTGDLSVWRIDDGVHHWVTAGTSYEALNAYLAHHEYTRANFAAQTLMPLSDVEVSRVDPSTYRSLRWTDESDSMIRTLFDALIADPSVREKATYLGCSEW
jgi:hypothetical protein